VTDMRVAKWDPVEPIPWATGLTACAILAGLTAAIDLILAKALADSFGWLWVPANVLIGLGLAPSLWLMRRARFWRWIAYGMALGLSVSWTVLLLGVLFRPPPGG
jgi:uncharacterized protein DUF2537